MCGIVGIIRQNKDIKKKEIDDLTDKMRHRGPDDRGIWIDGNKALGHRRLSIIDVSDGHQPMFSENGKVGVVFNGEIYNYKELKIILEKKGYQFRTNSDTEVLLYSYVEWQEKCLQKFRGMFAFCIIDKDSESLFLARDHIGIKPLVYYYHNDIFAFASEIKTIKEIQNVTLTLDLKAIDEYLFLQYIPAPRTVYNEVKKLKPAHYMKVSFSGTILEIKKYWDCDFEEDHSKTKDEWIDELDNILRESVRSHLIADVPFGAFLSGGIDSSLVVSYMSEILDKPVETFSIGFQEEKFNELSYANKVSENFSTRQHEEIITSKALEILPELVNYYGEPFGDSSAIPTYFVSRLASKHVPMVLSGDGADEIFAGYSTYKNWIYYQQQGGKYPLIKKIIRPILEYFLPLKYSPRIKYGDKLENWFSFINYAPKSNRHRLWKEEYADVVSNDIEIFNESFKHTNNYNWVHRVQYLDIKSYLPFDILAKVDTASMIHSLEVRTPFVDKELYEFARKIPSNINFSSVDGYGIQGKSLLKELLAKKMSKDFVYRKKMGFAMPVSEWFGGKSSFNQELNNRLLLEDSPIKQYFKIKEIRKIINGNHFGQKWLLLFLDEWLRQEKL